MLDGGMADVRTFRNGRWLGVRGLVIVVDEFVLFREGLVCGECPKVEYVQDCMSFLARSRDEEVSNRKIVPDEVCVW